MAVGDVEAGLGIDLGQCPFVKPALDLRERQAGDSGGSGRLIEGGF